MSAPANHSEYRQAAADACRARLIDFRDRDASDLYCEQDAVQPSDDGSVAVYLHGESVPEDGEDAQYLGHVRVTFRSGVAEDVTYID